MAGRRREAARGRDEMSGTNDLNVPLSTWGRRAPARGRNEGGPSNAPPPQETDHSAANPDIATALMAIAQVMQGQQEIQQRILQAQEERHQRNSAGTRAHYEHLKKANMPTFDGGADPEKAEKWLEEIERNFEILEVPDEAKSKVILPFLVGNAQKWWKGAQPAYSSEGRPVTWDIFKKAFLNHYFPTTLRLERQNQFFDLVQKDGMTVVEYASRFNALGQYVPSVMADSSLKTLRFVNGLQARIRARMSAVQSTNYEDAYQRSLNIEMEIRRGEVERGIKRQNTDQFSQTRLVVPRVEGQRGRRQAPMGFNVNTTTGMQHNLCNFCKRYHDGECRWKTGVCFGCGKSGHKMRDCPQSKQQMQPQNQPKPTEEKKEGTQRTTNARVFALPQRATEEETNKGETHYVFNLRHISVCLFLFYFFVICVVRKGFAV
jgi:hypothetical protein